MNKRSLPFLVFLALGAITGQSQVVINEIMYHPSSENVAEEYIELHNRAVTNVNLGGWQISSGVQFTFAPNTIIPANGYLVVAAHRQTFTNKYPSVANVVGNWVGLLSNSRNDIDLDDANGDRVDSVEYADEGDWAIRRRGTPHSNHRGWIWYKEHDGLGKSLELINPAMPNEHGQNWAASIAVQGTPGAQNSVRSANIAPFILEFQHFPTVPSSGDVVTISARLLDESASGVTARLNWRIDGETSFASDPMFDDGSHGDGAAGDGLWAAQIGPHNDNTVIEFYVSASDAQSNTRTWPAAALPATDETGSPAQSANALYQVDDSPQNLFGGVPSHQPVYKMIMTEAERVELTSQIQGGDRNSDAQMNGTWITLDAAGAQVRYSCGFRNRGHGSRGAGNFRANFSSDNPWQDVVALNLNVVEVPSQHLGSVLALKSGAAGAYTRPVQVRVNNANRVAGSYAANEALNSEWAERHFPDDDGGNVYRAIRDIFPPTFDYRGENKNSYTNTWFKETNVSEDDWSDLIGMLRTVGLSGTDAFTESNVRQVVNVEQWMTHLAVMNLLGNAETGLNSGYNDDYFMYRGVTDPRFILMYYDLDQILGRSSMAANSGIFTCTQNNGAGLALNRFIHDPAFEPIYYATLHRLLNTTFSESQFNTLVDQTLGSYVSTTTINNMKSWMAARRSTVQALISGFTPTPGVATITGEPRSPTPFRSATLTVGGNDIVAYRFKLNNGSYTGERPVGSNIFFPNSLFNGSTNTVYVLGKTSAGGWQSTANPTVSRTWVVNTLWPTVRLNEVLARNATAINHAGTFPDYVELYNEGTASVDISGMRLTDDPSDPNKFSIPPGTTLAPGAYLPLYADTASTPGLHLGFSLNDMGDGVYLFHRASSGGALLDSVKFGTQLPDLSIGRTNGSSGGTWVLCTPTHDAPNVGVARGNRHNLRINEWLASPQSPFVDDFIEIFNPSSAPVDLGGLHLTDTPIGAPLRHRIPDLTFIPAVGYFVFTADGEEGETDHVNFQLSSDLGEIALMTTGLETIDCVNYGPQRPGISMGRCPDGSLQIDFMVLPTPGSPNACPTPPPEPETVTLLNFSHTWSYDETGTNWGTVWRETDFDDSAWSAGQGLLAAIRGGGSFPEPVRTPLTVSNTKTTFYFRTHFTLPPNANFSSFQMTHIIDDGAVFYINGVEAVRYNLPPPPNVILNTTLASQNILDATYSGPVTLSPAFFVPGDNVIAVEVHQGNPSSADIALGLLLQGVIITNTPGQAGLVINEVLANNGTLADLDGSTPDWMEFYNPSDSPVDLVGMSLSDTTLNPDRFVFGTGSIVPARGYLAIRFDADRPLSATNTGFGLSASGDSLYLFNPDNTVLDFVNFGIQAADFSIGRQGSLNWNLCIPTIGSTNIPAILGNVMNVRINEWMADPPSGEDDWFELYNPNPQPVAIGLCWLTDTLSTRQKHQIWPLSFMGASTNWQRFACDPDPAADHVSFNLRAAGEDLGFSLPNGAPIDSISFTQQVVGVSEGRLPDGAPSIVKFPGTPSPGDPNYVLMNNVVISEVLTHSDEPVEDAIEIQNIGASTVNISGWWLSDSRGVPRKYQIPTVAPIPPGGFRVFYEYQFNDRDVAPIPFSLNSGDGDEVYLSSVVDQALTGARAQAEFGAAENRVSFGRHRTSQGFDFVSMSRHTFGADMPINITQFRGGAGLSNAYPKIGPIVITEVMYHPPDIGTNDNVIEEFIELHNPAGVAAPLYHSAYPSNTWRLRGGADFDFPPNRSIAPGGYLLVVSFDPTNNPAALAAFRSRYGNNSVLAGPYTGKLDNGGEAVRLLKPDSPNTNAAGSVSVPYVLVDHVSYSDRAPWPTNADGFGASLQRIHAMGYANDPTNWLSAAPTPGPSGAADSDGDGLPDSWEQQYFGSPTAGVAGADSDGDGMTNLQEYQAGTHPLNASSRLRISSVGNTGSMVTLQFNAVSNRTYAVQYRDSLSTGSWSLLTTLPASPTNKTHTVSDTDIGASAQRFYRIATP